MSYRRREMGDWEGLWPLFRSLSVRAPSQRSGRRRERRPRSASGDDNRRQSAAAARADTMLASVNINLGRKLVRNWKDKGKPGAPADAEDTTSRYRPGDLQALARSTKFTRRELQFFYRGFKQECPSGSIDEDSFREIYAKFFPFGDSNQYAHLLFNVLDKTQSGSISFDDFIFGLSTLIKGSTEDRLAWTFNLYDVNNDGFITQDEMLQVVSAIYRLIDTSQSDRISPEERGQDLFTRIDENHDGIITLEEFMAYCSKDSTILSGLDMYSLMWEA